MKIEFIKLLNFRNYNQLNISFHPSLNIICGNNGSGKTNLVEAIYVLALTRSFRLVSYRTLIMDNFSLSKIEGNVNNRYSINYQVVLNKEGKKVKINHNRVAKISDYISKITIVLFHPDDLRFIKDTPSTRRNGLNISISEINIEYLRYLNNYNKILKQRNAYLKQMYINNRNDYSYLDIVTTKLVDYGLYIYQKRKKFVDKINEKIGFYYQKISGTIGLKIQYISNYNDLKKEDIISNYKKYLSKDMTFGKTSFGIHTDDLKFYLNDKDLKEYGSEGQQKNAIIAYKFCELEIFKEITGSYPILILDDLFSELDEEKIVNIINLLREDFQTFITTTNIKHFDDLSYKKINIENGKIMEESVHERRK